MRLPFKDGAPTVCARDFVYAGRSYVRGQEFPHAELKLTRWEVWSLYNAFLIDCTAPPRAAERVAVEPPAQARRHRHQR